MRAAKNWLNILSFHLLFAAAPALALMPVAQLNKPGCQAINHSQTQNFRDLLIEVNISDVDTRDNASESDFDADEVAALTAITGTVTCRSGDYVSSAKARLYQDETTIMTSAHLFVDKTNESVKGNARRIDETKLPKCTFSTKADPTNEIDLKLDHPSSFKFGSNNPLNDRTNDYAFVKLARPVDAKWIPKFGNGPRPDEVLHLVTTDAKGSSKQIDPNQLVVQKCGYRFGDGREDIGFFNNCSTLTGDSFGIYYAKRNGQWEAVAFQVATGQETANGLAFDIANADVKKRSFSFAAGFSSKFNLDGAEFQRRSSGQADATGGRKINAVTPNKS